MADFDRLVARAHALGLKVVIDQVYAHTSDQHAWFQRARRDRPSLHSRRLPLLRHPPRFRRRPPNSRTAVGDTS